MLVYFLPLAGMQKAGEETERKSSVIVQKTKICNHGEARYKLASTLNGVSGYDLADDFKNAVRLLLSIYSVDDYRYTEFLDVWGTVSAIKIMTVHEANLQNECIPILLFPHTISKSLKRSHRFQLSWNLRDILLPIGLVGGDTKTTKTAGVPTRGIPPM